LEELAVAVRADPHSLRMGSLTALSVAVSGKEGLAALEQAATTHTATCMPVVAAPARLEYGATLRRDGHRAEARPWLRESYESASRLAVRQLADRAHEELIFAGGRPRSRFSTGVEALTPSERRVADHAAAGLSNREIAETLFVTRKTVELHLGNAYGKLRIRSRTQLPAALGQ
jgi:DNA-binding CsgD family transcriptional regulator